MKFMKYTVRFVSTLIWFASLNALHAQNTQVTGAILDPSRAPVMRAHVTLTRTDNGERRETSSSEDGYFVFPLLLPGQYDLAVQKEGFRSVSQKSIKVETGQITPLEIVLTLGE